MRKITLFFALAISIGMANATLIKSQLIELVNFTAATALPAGWSSANDANYSLYGTGGGYNLTTPANQLNVTTGNSSKNQGVKITFPTSGTETEVYVEFDWKITSATVTSKNALALTLKDNVAAAFTTTGDILTLYCSGTDGMIHCQNIDNTAPVLQDLSANGSFLKSGTDAATCNTNNASTITTCGWALGNTIHVKALLNFTTFTVSYLQLTNVTTSTSYENTTGMDFLSGTASNLSKICITNTRVSPSGSGSNSVSNTSIDNFETYKMIDVQLATVTVKYYDATNNALVTTVTRDAAVGSTYTISTTDKKSFTFGGNYCVFSSIISDNATVAADGSSYVRLKVKRYPVTSGVYSWVGGIDSNWNELTANFTVDGTSSLGYQPLNAVKFSNAGVLKTVSLNELVDLGTSDLTIDDTDYNISGAGAVTGTGKMNVNLTTGQKATLNFSNLLSGVTQVSGGRVLMAKTGALGSNVLVTGDATFEPMKSVVFPTTTFNTSAAIACDTSNATINTMSAGAGIKIAISSQFNTLAAVSSFLFGTSGVLTGGAELEFTGNGTENRFGMTSASTTYLAAAKVNLKGNSFFYIDTNQGAATTINVGTLAGESTAKLGWGRSSALDRTISWSVGALNENSEYAGTISNVGGYSSGGSFYTGNFTHLIKEGTGTLTLSGRVNKHNGNFTVNNGALLVTDSICKSTSTVTVGANGTLKGTGVIGGAATINGTLEGRLNFGSSLTLAGTTKIVVNGFNSGEYDVINVVGALTYGGALNVTVNGGNPSIGTSIKIMNFASQTGDFTQPITAPANYSYNKETGMLTYDGTTDITKTDLSKVRIYPTVSNGTIKVEGNVARIEIVNTLGQIVKNEILSSTTVNLSNLSAGSYLIKAYTAEGNSITKMVFYQK